ncbi:hypothetical protein BE04_40285 [Sorangium cellulosum]|uniref:Uncharacterized protein n=1 Tax=Sorangium cellulosum TaxID=56 RepID=A0A150PQ82_SORCE|nr:hypothetical protein BE04_40285 [Sorangium cellulosum]
MVEQLYRKFGVAQENNQRVRVLKQHLPYREADHVLAEAMNVYVGGRCLEDMATLQKGEAVALR